MIRGVDCYIANAFDEKLSSGFDESFVYLKSYLWDSTVVNSGAFVSGRMQHFLDELKSKQLLNNDRNVKYGTLLIVDQELTEFRSPIVNVGAQTLMTGLYDFNYWVSAV